MTIRKGEPWGVPGPLAPDGVEISADADAGRIISDARRSGNAIPVLGLLGGDLCRTVGGRGDAARLRSADAMTLPVDLGIVHLDGVEHYFVAHVVVRSPWWTGSWWRGPVTAVMNAQWVGHWDVAPRSHPNDGLLDVFEADLSLDDRMKARGRLATGTHVPHPGIAERRVDALTIVGFGQPAVWIDGVFAGRASELAFHLEPDALVCVV